jgi:hypothetical protein
LPECGRRFIHARKQADWFVVTVDGLVAGLATADYVTDANPADVDGDPRRWHDPNQSGHLALRKNAGIPDAWPSLTKRSLFDADGDSDFKSISGASGNVYPPHTFSGDVSIWKNRGRVSDRTPDQFLVLALDSLEGCPALRVEHGCRPGQGWSGDQTPPFKPRSPPIIGLATYCNRC